MLLQSREDGEVSGRRLLIASGIGVILGGVAGAIAARGHDSRTCVETPAGFCMATGKDPTTEWAAEGAFLGGLAGLLIAYVK